MFASRVGFYKQPATAQTYVTVGSGGTVLSSNNLSTWTSRRTQAGHRYNDVTRAHNSWIIAGNDSSPNPLIITSSDLTSYTTRSNPTGGASPWTDYEGRGIVTNGTDTNIVVQNTTGAYVYYSWGSTDGVNWTSQSVGNVFGYNSGYSVGAKPKPTFFDGVFAMSGARSNPPPNYSSTYYTASDPTAARTAVNITTSISNYATFVEKATSSLYVAWVGGTSAGFYRSTNGSTWSAATAITTRMNAAAYGAGIAVAVGANGEIYTSPTGVTWTSRTSGTIYDLWDIIWDGTQFVAVGEQGTIITSSNGITWASKTSGTIESLYAITVA